MDEGGDVNVWQETVLESLELQKLNLRAVRYLALVTEEEYQEKLKLVDALLERLHDPKGLESIRVEDR